MEKVYPIRDKNIIEKVKNYLLQQSYRNYFIFFLGINTGLRISDMINLKVQDIKNKDEIILKERKTGKKKVIPLVNKEIVSEIYKYCYNKKDNDYLFPNKQGQAMSRNNAWQILNKAGKDLGIKLTPYVLRKTFGYWYYKATKDIVKLQMIFNHSSSAITFRYICISDDEITESLRDFSL